MKRYPADQRRRDLAAIHAAKRDLGMDDETYRDVLWTVVRVRSAGELDQAGRNKLLDHFRSRGWEPKKKHNEWAFIDNAAADRKPLLKKICMVCKSMNVGKAYAEGTAKRQHGIDRKLEMMDEGQLWLLAGVLERTRKSKEHSK
ncbi:MAG: regulatory protein GemA [Pseudomonadota bacterium]